MIFVRSVITAAVWSYLQTHAHRDATDQYTLGASAVFLPYPGPSVDFFSFV